MVGFFSLVISLMVVMAWFDGQTTYISSSHMSDISGMSDTSVVTGTQPTGETSTTVQWRGGLWNTILKWINFDFSFWYESIETGWTKDTCESAGGRWDGANNLCGFPNQWEIVRNIVFMPIGWGIVLALIALTVGKIFGLF